MNYSPKERIRSIRLYGVLGARFGREQFLAVDSAAEAVRTLDILFPGFDQFMRQAKDNGLVFAIFHRKRNIGQDELRDPPGRSEIRIAPMIQGSERAGQLQNIVGVAIIVAASYFSGAAAAGVGSTSLFGSAAGAALGALGISPALSGVAQMVAGPP